MRVNQTVDDLKYAISQNLPVVFGFLVYDSFMRVKSDGIMPMPDTKREKVQGGHAVVAVGYNEKYFIVRNSWGANWGDGGYFYMPIEFISDPQMASDFWVVQQVLAPPPHKVVKDFLTVCKDKGLELGAAALKYAGIAKDHAVEYTSKMTPQSKINACAIGTATLLLAWWWGN